MHFITSATIILDALLAAVILYFLLGLKWENDRARASIVGFIIMIGVYILNIALIAVLMRHLH